MNTLSQLPIVLLLFNYILVPFCSFSLILALIAFIRNFFMITTKLIFGILFLLIIVFSRMKKENVSNKKE